MKAGLTTVLSLVLVPVLAGTIFGCGQKGALYREAPADAEVSQEAEAEPEDNEKTRADGY